MTPAPVRDDPFAVGSAVADDLRRVDWRGPPPGSPQRWPPSQRTVVRAGLGRPAAEVWAEVWPDVEGRVRRVRHSGESTWDAARLLFPERSGFVGEACHTFSSSPLTDDGRIVGLLCVVTEETEPVVAERRWALRCELGAHTRATPGPRACLAGAARLLAGSPRRLLSFSLIYRYDDQAPPGAGAAPGATLAGCGGVPSGHPLAPPAREPGRRTDPWLDDEMRAGSRAVLAPLLVQAAGFLVVAATPYRPLDQGCRRTGRGRSGASTGPAVRGRARTSRHRPVPRGRAGRPARRRGGGVRRGRARQRARRAAPVRPGAPVAGAGGD